MAGASTSYGGVRVGEFGKLGQGAGMRTTLLVTPMLPVLLRSMTPTNQETFDFWVSSTCKISNLVVDL